MTAAEKAIERLRDPVRNHGRFICLSCGWDRSLLFAEDEIKALGGDVSSYEGPCGKCDLMTLVEYSKVYPTP